MVKVPKYIVTYAVIFAACYLAMPFIVIAEYKARGYLAFGGEWLTPVLVVLTLELVRSATKSRLSKKKAGGKRNGK